MVKNDLFCVKRKQYGLFKHSIFLSFLKFLNIFMFFNGKHRLKLHAYDLLLKTINPINITFDAKQLHAYGLLFFSDKSIQW
jgi:hypothetical protein